MSDHIAIKVENVSKTFKLPHEKVSSVKSAVINFYKRKRTYEKQQVLNDVSFEIKKGEFFGIVGRNGSGKSTLLKLLAGIYSPDSGQIHINGKLTPFIELGVGFSPELTGRENVFLNGSLLGFSRKEMEKMYDDIVEFAELERFMDQKLKNYSSGMQVRLAFSIAIRANNDMLVLDEVLAVGDVFFQKKCFDYFKTLKRNKKTVVFVSHDSEALKRFCDRGILLEGGKLIAEGKIDKILSQYGEINSTEDNKANLNNHKPSSDNNKNIIIKQIRTGKNSQSIFKADDKVEIEVEYESRKKTTAPVYGITIHNEDGINVFQSNTLWCNQKTEDTSPNKIIVYKWSIPNTFNTGEYFVSSAVSDQQGFTVIDSADRVASFSVKKDQKSHGIVNTKHKIEKING